MDYLMHHGIKGQKWGVRRWQNSDGTLTSEGKQRYHQKIDRDARLAKGLTTSFGAYGDINFKRDEAHMYVESGKYFMQRSVNVNRH